MKSKSIARCISYLICLLCAVNLSACGGGEWADEEKEITKQTEDRKTIPAIPLPGNRI